MLDYAEYTIDGNGYQGNGNGNGNGHHHNGYDKLDGEWLDYYKVAKNFTHKVKPEDREDFLHDLLLEYNKIAISYKAKGKGLTTGGLIRIAQYRVANYWRQQYKHLYGRTCSQCSKIQRARCKTGDLYRQCPKAIKLESLDTIIEDGNGDYTTLSELLADDNAIDLNSRLEAKLILHSYPIRFVKLAYKKYAGFKLDKTEQNYFYRQQKKAQKCLV
jgi:hypothetical protein